ncbi:MAG: FtsQ-type POTRA domain-containing protein [Leptolyngbyaceae cyanobacterium SM1_3_5]|nr:FtsQ-type POTRA domain-containing protein [Leptolyngbyaceae cyanobacterium SM1_3_5]
MPFADVSRAELTERRRQLRRQRKVRIMQASWRLLFVLGIAGGSVWVMSLPAWVVRQPQQVEVQGNRLLSTATVQKLLPIAYPQSLWQIQPEAIAQRLKQQAPIAQATVSRQLFPPRLKVQIQERTPVAIAVSADNTISLLDAQGHAIPLQSFQRLHQSIALPSLKVLGMRDQYRSQWTTLHPLISTSPVKISEIDWREPTNLILKTELGIVHLGALSPRLNQQLRSLDRMRQIGSNVNPTEIAYIDLRSPDSPLVQLVQDSRTPPPAAESTP